MQQIQSLEIVGIIWTQDNRGLTTFTILADALPIMSGPTVISETNRLTTGKAVHPIAVGPVTIRSLN